MPPLLQKIPEDLIRWLVEDISAENLQKILAARAFKDRLEGRRPNAVPKEKSHQLLIQEFKGNISFRTFLGGVWKEQRKEDLKAMDVIPSERFPEMRGELVRKYGLPFIYWVGLFSEKVVLQKTAVRVAVEFSMRADSVPADVHSAHDSELRRLKEDLSEAQARLQQLAIEAEESRQWARKLQTESESLKEQSVHAERRLAAEKKKSETLDGKIVKLEEKIRSLSNAEHTIHSLEKTQKSLEHELKTALQSSELGRNQVAELEVAADEYRLRFAEMEKTLEACFGILSEGGPSSGGRLQGAVLIIGQDKNLSGDYYEKAAPSGLQILYRSGFKKDADLEKMVKKADQILLFVPKWDDVVTIPDLMGFLRKNGVPFRVLPVLSPEQLAAFLASA